MGESFEFFKETNVIIILVYQSLKFCNRNYGYRFKLE